MIQPEPWHVQGFYTMTRNRTEYLQAIADELKQPDTWEFWVEFRCFQGWYMVAEQARWFGDTGEFLGTNWKEAEKTIRYLIG